MVMGLGFALRGAAQGFGQGVIDEAARKREDALRAAEQAREDTIRQREREQELEDYERRRQDELEDYGLRRGDQLEDYDRTRGDTLADRDYEDDREDADVERNSRAIRGVLGRDQHETALNAAEYLIGRGMDPILAVGAVGNLLQESSLLPEHGEAKDGDGGASGGYGQWNGSRFDDLKAYADENERDWKDLDTQLDFLLWETENTEAANYQRIVDANPQTPEDAAELWSENFWRPGDPEVQNRRDYAKDIWAARNWEEYAAEALADPDGGLTGDAADAVGRALGLDVADAEAEGWKNIEGVRQADGSEIMHGTDPADGVFKPLPGNIVEAPPDDDGDSDGPTDWSQVDDSEFLDEIADRAETYLKGKVDGSIILPDQAADIAEWINNEVLAGRERGLSPSQAWAEVHATLIEDLQDGTYDGVDAAADAGSDTGETVEVPGVAVGSDGRYVVEDDADFDALPSGAEFVGPDGQIRKKP